MTKRVKWFAAAMAAAVLTSGPAWAQPTPASATFNLTPAERAALLPIKQAVDARNWSLAASLAPAARAAVRGNDARYVLARLQLDIAVATQNRAAHNEALTALLELRRSSAPEQADLLRQYAAIAYDAGNVNAAEATLNRALQLAPNEPETLSMLAEVYRAKSDNARALASFQRAIQFATAAGRPFPESRYKAALALAEQTGQRPAAMEIARNFIAAYPSPRNWRDVLLVFRTVGTVDAGQSLDAMRLMRAAGALAGERDYMALATALDQAGYPAEAKAVIDEGVERRHLTASDSAPRALAAAAATRAARERSGLAAQIAQARQPSGTAAQARTTADTLLAHGRYADAAEMYRLALTRVGEDPDYLNSRLGIALALVGQRDEAGAALGASTGARADLSALWAIWLARRPA